MKSAKVPDTDCVLEATNAVTHQSCGARPVKLLRSLKQPSV